MARLLDARHNWALVIEDANQQGVAGLLHRHLAQSAEVPAWVVDQLSAIYFGQAAQNAVLCRELGRILRALHGEAAAAVVPNGAALAEQIYGEIGLRPMRDVDLLIRESQLPAAYQIMAELGTVPLHQSSAQRLGYHLPALVCPDVGLPVELIRLDLVAEPLPGGHGGSMAAGGAS